MNLSDYNGNVQNIKQSFSNSYNNPHKNCFVETMQSIFENQRIVQLKTPLPLENIPIVYIWFGKVVPEDYLISLSETDYPVRFFKNPKIERKFSRQLMDIEKSDYYRLWYLYEHGGIYSDFDNTIDYPCLIKLLKEYQNQDKLIFMTDDRHTRQKTQQITTNLIYAPYPKMPILKKMLDYIDESKEKVWKFAGIKFVGQFQQPIEANLSKCVYHSYDWSWYEASNQVLGASAEPHPHYLKKLIKKSQLLTENTKINQQLNEKKNQLYQMESDLRRISNDNIELKNQVLEVHDQIVAICPSASKILSQYEESLSSPTTLFFSSQNSESSGQTLSDKNEIRLCNRVNTLRSQNSSLRQQKNILEQSLFGLVFLIVLILLIGFFYIRKRKEKGFKQIDVQQRPSSLYQ